MTTDFRFTSFLLLFTLACVTVRGDTASKTIQWRSLTQVQRSLGVTNHLWNGETICFSNDQDVLRFYPGRRKAEVNGTVVWLNVPAEGSVTDGSWGLAAIDLDFLKLSVLPRPPDLSLIHI